MSKEHILASKTPAQDSGTSRKDIHKLNSGNCDKEAIEAMKKDNKVVKETEAFGLIQILNGLR